MELLRLSIRQTFATTAIETRQAKLNIESPSGDLDIQTSQATMEITRQPAELTVDSSQAWMALGRGNHLEWYRMVSNQMEEEYLLNLSRIVEEGNRLADFTKPNNTVADMMVNRIQEQSNIQYVGEASSNNVRLEYTPSQADIHWNSHETDINYTPNKPQTTYEPGAVDVYIKNKNSLQMWVSNYDFYG